MPLAFTLDTSGLRLHTEGLMANAVLFARLDSRMPPKKAARFPRAARLLRHADFERVYKQGRRHFSSCMTVFYWPRPELDAKAAAEKVAAARARVPAPHKQPVGLRVGFTVGRVLGGAVQRNRMKRRLREAVRRARPVQGVAADVVINPKKALLAADFSDVLNEMNRAFGVIEQKLSGKAPAADLVKASRQDAGSHR